MTKSLYYDDAYQREFSAVVVQADVEAGKPTRVVLDQTAFYPGGGGQPYDIGFLTVRGEQIEVARIKRERGEIWHQLADEIALDAGEAVRGELDWDRRYQLMRTHTAMHILCGVVWRDYGASVTGGNMEPGKGRMDFEFESLSRELIGEIEAKCNAEVEAARSVTSRSLPREEAFQIPDLIRTKINLLPEGIREVRIVELEGLDLQADGGTHVANTREVGGIKIVDYKSKGAINKRVYIELAQQDSHQD